ncbi:MAG TPA: hypothetical protein DCE81_04690 [Cytophagales bacterium]|nr:hypothetical protein [Cytophagales bacterium]
MFLQKYEIETYTFKITAVSLTLEKIRVMDVKEMDRAILEIVSKRLELEKVDYNNPHYDELEEQLHDLEDAFQVNHGEALASILQEVHDEWCPDSELLYPIAYLAKHYDVNGNNEYVVSSQEGVYVEVEKLPGRETKLVIVPNPLRLILNIGKEKQQVVWPK